MARAMTSRSAYSPTPDFRFHLAATSGKARTGALTMPRGIIRTPAFMPVGTAATVKGLYAEQVRPWR